MAFCSWVVSVVVVSFVMHNLAYGKAPVDRHNMGHLLDFYSQEEQLVQNIIHLMV
jgi:hypothetical protein